MTVTAHGIDGVRALPLGEPLGESGPVDITQDNSNISIPFMVSSKGYGVYWNNDSRSRLIALLIP